MDRALFDFRLKQQPNSVIVVCLSHRNALLWWVALLHGMGDNLLYHCVE